MTTSAVSNVPNSETAIIVPTRYNLLKLLHETSTSEQAAPSETQDEMAVPEETGNLGVTH